MIMAEKTEQLSFQLRPVEPYGMEYFVPHRGVVQAVAVLDQALGDVAAAPENFRMVFLWGPPGSGKTHLCEAYHAAALKRGLAPHKIRLVDLEERLVDSRVSDNDESAVAEFVACYEQLRASGGMLIVCARRAPAEVSSNPHLKSRILAAASCELAYPLEEELPPLLSSLLSRHNLKLSPRSQTYLLRRLPLAPLSFDNIFARISELSFSQSKPAGLGLVRESVEAEEEKPS